MAAQQNGEIDAAIIANQPTESNLQGDILYYEQFFGYVAHNESIFKKDLIRTADINDERLWLLDEGHSRPPAADAFSPDGEGKGSPSRLPFR